MLLARCFDFVFDLERSQPLMVQDFAGLAFVELEVRMTEVNKADTCDEQQQPWVVTLTLRLEGIITELVAVWFVVNIMFLFEGVTVRVR